MRLDKHNGERTFHYLTFNKLFCCALGAEVKEDLLKNSLKLSLFFPFKLSSVLGCCEAELFDIDVIVQED